MDPLDQQQEVPGEGGSVRTQERQGGQEDLGAGVRLPSEDGEGQQEQQGQQREQRQSKHVPYERFQEVNTKLAEYQAQLAKQQEELNRLRMPLEEQQEAARHKALQERFYKDPAAYVEERSAEFDKKLSAVKEEMGDFYKYQSALQQLRSAPGYSQELENEMVKHIKEFGQSPNGREATIRAAYQGVTGKKFGHWASDGYQTRMTKERLMRPQGGGAGGFQSGGMTIEEFENLDLNEFAKNPAQYIRALEASVRAQ